MTEIEVTGTVAKIIPPRDTYTQGQLGTARLHFTFDDAWQGYTDLKAIFDCGVASADAAIVNNECTVPQDVLATPYRIIQISISGNDGTNAISTAWVRLGQVLPSGTSGGGGRFVTFDELAQMLLNYVTFGDLDDYVTKAELTAAIADLAKKDELDALTAAFDALVLAVDDKADKSELDKYVLKSVYDDFVQAVNDALALKADLTDVWKKSEITLVTSGDGKSFLGNDGQYHVIQSGGGDAKAFIAEYNVTTAQEIIDFIDASNEPYAPMQVKRAGSYYTVVTAVKQDTDKVIIRTFGTLSGSYYMFTYTITGNVWASSSYGFQQTLVSGTNIKTINGESLLGSGNIEVQGSGTQVQADWNETDTTKPAYIKNKPDIPDVSGFATKESVQAVSDTVSTLSGTVINQGVSIQNLTNDKADKATLADYATTEYVDGNFAKTTDIPDVSGFETTAHADATFAKKSEIPDVSGFETTAHANSTFATKDALTTGLAGKVDTATLDDYETSAHANATFATKDALNTATDACWKKSEIGLETSGTGTLFLANDGTYRPASGDPPDLTPYLKKTEAENIYATIANHNALATRVTTNEADIATLKTGVTANTTAITALQTSVAEKAAASDVQALTDRVTAAENDIDTLETDVAALKTGQVKSVTASGFTVTPDTNGNVNVGGTDVSRTATMGSWGSEITYTIAQTLPTGASSDTKGSSLTVVKRTENNGANPTIKMTVDGVQLATSADVPDVSNFATLDYVQNTYETSAHASETYRKIVDATDITTEYSFNGSTGAATVSGKIAQTTAGEENYVSIGGMVFPNGKTYDAGVTFIVKKGSKSVGFVVPTKADMTEALATKADATSVADILTKTEAASTYETTAHASETYLPIALRTDVTSTGSDTSVGVVIAKPLEGSGANTCFISAQTPNGTSDKRSNCTIKYQQVLPNGGGIRSREIARVVTWDEFTDFTTTASPIKSIKVDRFNVLTPDANGQVTTGRTPVSISQSETEGIKNFWVNVYEELPGGVSGPGEGASLGIRYKANDTELTSFEIVSGMNLATSTYYEMPTKKWVREYIASLDGTNISA